jgi:hypothetical protein
MGYVRVRDIIKDRKSCLPFVFVLVREKKKTGLAFLISKLASNVQKMNVLIISTFPGKRQKNEVEIEIRLNER